MGEIKVGSVVFLASGGPKMTVGSIKDGQAACRWFVRDQTTWAYFDVATLRLGKEAEDGEQE